MSYTYIHTYIVLSVCSARSLHSHWCDEFKLLRSNPQRRKRKNAECHKNWVIRVIVVAANFFVDCINSMALWQLIRMNWLNLLGQLVDFNIKWSAKLKVTNELTHGRTGKRILSALRYAWALCYCLVIHSLTYIEHTYIWTYICTCTLHYMRPMKDVTRMGL